METEILMYDQPKLPNEFNAGLIYAVDFWQRRTADAVNQLMVTMMDVRVSVQRGDLDMMSAAELVDDKHREIRLMDAEYARLHELESFKLYNNPIMLPEPPIVGKGATLHYPQDKYGYVVIAVSKSGKKVTMLRLSTNGLKKTGEHNGFPVINHYYTPEELSAQLKDDEGFEYAYLTKNGYRMNSADVTFGSARYYRDYSD